MWPTSHGSPALKVYRLPLWVVHEPGESLLSWIDRGAQALDVSRKQAWHLLGLVPELGLQPAANGLDLTFEQREAIGTATGISPDGLPGMLVSRFGGGVIDMQGLDCTDRSSILRWSWANWVPIWGSRCCVQCLRTRPGVWQTSWRLPWSLICPIHRAWMLSRCPRCGARLQAVSSDRRQGEQCCAREERRDLAMRHAGRVRDGVCGYVLTDTAPSAAPLALVNLQVALDAARDAKSGTSEGPNPTTAKAPAAEVFNDLRLLIKLVHRAGTSAVAHGLDDRSAEAWREWIARRDDVGGRGDCSYAHMSAERLAGPIQVAAGVAFARDTDLQVAWSELMRTVEFDQRRSWFRVRPRGLSVRHETAMNLAAERRLFGLTSSLDGRAARPVSPSRNGLRFRVRVEQLPRLLWPSVHQAVCAGILPGSDVGARRLTAISLVRLIRGDVTSWLQAAEVLGWSRGVEVQSSALRAQVKASGRGPAFAARLRGVLDELEQAEFLISYGKRRRLLADLDDVGEEHWTRLCDVADVDDRHSETWSYRRLIVSARVWALLTGDVARESPAAVVARERFPHRRFSLFASSNAEYWFSRMRPSVDFVCRAVLREHQLAGPVTQDDLHAQIALRVADTRA